MKKYETVIILDEKGVGDDGASFLAEFENTLKMDLEGKVVESVNMGRRQFAREMRKRKTGIYLDVVHELKPESEKLLREKYRLDDRVLRLQTFVFDRPDNVQKFEI